MAHQLFFLNKNIIITSNKSMWGITSIHSMGKDMVKQNIIFCQTKSFASPSRVLRGLALSVRHLRKRKTWHNSSSFSYVLYTWLFLWVSFLWDSHKPVAKTTCSSFGTWVFTDLSYLSLTINPTYIQGKWLKKLQSNLVRN